ncbi:predicted protein [Chaetoceros tenuissimus]|uniref:Uncharacterized protein n=1 Tax=Chaetoceros tenuissimus TaxID=426638 RepID=A0AAD3GYY8_9STRA|nr:predicted protein [Chaetoceros tenuissimus]
MKSNKPYHNYPHSHFCFVLLVILTTSQVKFANSGQVVCPNPSARTFHDCSTSPYDPVECYHKGSELRCRYDNQCLADLEHGKYPEWHCKKLNSNRCPKKGSTFHCMGWESRYDPVECGKDQCRYDNQCFATTASSEFTAETCVKLCPQSPTYSSACSYQEDPVECGIKTLSVKCIYDNQCFATVASSNFTAETCDKVCPDSSNNSACSIDVVDPVECWKDITGKTYECEYQNQCFANAAGFSTANCWNVCPKSFVQARNVCEDLYDPVKCGKCEYQNQCTATSSFSGFTADTCEKTGCLEKYKQDDDCEDVYDPVICEGSECEFNNQCSATAASYLFTAETCQKVCPESSADIACPTTYDPVKCDTCKKSCKTSNNIFLHDELCEDSVCEDSTSYKFKLDNGNERRCSFITKKDTRKRQEMYCNGETATACCNACKREKCEDKEDFKFKLKNGKSAGCSWFQKVYDPVKCGNKPFQCTYDNQCFATAASTWFTTETCSKLCPDPDPVVGCIKLYDPVTCGENFECEYDNQCIATAASRDFTTRTCKNLNEKPRSGCPKSSHPCTEENIRLNKSKGEHYFCPQSSCIEKYDPVKCGENFECEYDNQCLAKLASEEFTAENCKKLDEPPSNACPPVWSATDDDVTCARYSYDLDPVKCGDLKCEYDNQCYATSASSDFTEETCELLDDSPNKVCPPEKSSYEDIACSKFYYDPVKCGDLECEYDNPCLAKASSYLFTTAKTCKKVCPESPADIACPTTYDPVKCGNLECVYKNQCLATAASPKEFTAETCKQACTIGNNIFLHKPCDEDSVCEDLTSYKFKLDNGNERRCSFISKKHTRKRQDMYCKGETATKCCNACKREKCEDESDFKFKLKNGKSADCSWFEKDNPSTFPSMVPSETPSSFPSSVPTSEPTWLDDEQCKKKDPENDICVKLDGRCKVDCEDDEDFVCVPGLCSYDRNWDKPTKFPKMRELKEKEVDIVDIEISADGNTERKLKAPKTPKAPKSSCACRVPRVRGCEI